MLAHKLFGLRPASLRSVEFCVVRGFAAAASEPISSANGGRSNYEHGGSSNGYNRWALSGAAASLVAAGCLYANSQRIYASAEANSASSFNFEPPIRDDLPVFSLAEVSRHSSADERMWTTFGRGVYDITEFVRLHPGGSEKISLAAGGSLEPFWALYAQHKTPEVLEILEELRIGSVDPNELQARPVDPSDPYAGEPSRHRALAVVSARPFNAETPAALLNDSLRTPNELFFVRNHLPVPAKVNERDYRLTIELEDKRQLSLSLDQLKRKFERVSFDATVMCAGNRREELSAVKAVKGLAWGPTAISNARWTGVRLTDVLKAAKIDLTKGGIKHVHFTGLDKDPTGQYYEASIPVDKASSPEVILAFEMNGEPLPIDHGFPLRVIVPGVVGARQVKWLWRVRASARESDSHWQQKDYRSFSPSTDWDTVDFSNAPSVQEAPVQSAICLPANETILPKGASEVEVKGYAWSGGGRGIIRVDVSADGGKTWHVATLQQDPEQDLVCTLDMGSRPPNLNLQRAMWAWTLWSAVVPLPDSTKKGEGVEVVCKAVDSSYNVQPDSPEGIWNLRGLLNNSWHKVHLKTSK